MITAERLREILNYDPDTGIFTWLPRAGNVQFNSQFAGQIAGGPRPSGHIYIMISDRNYAAHRLAVLYMTGKWPPLQVDHKDVCPSNNRWKNLREATHSQNLRNQKTNVNNALGLKCVSKVARPGKQFRARIWIDGKRVHLGYFRTAGEASMAYAKKAQEVFGEFARAA